jgi:hypothetical protein
LPAKPRRKLPAEVRRVLPADTATTWLALAPHLPAALYLGGGTAVAVHLAHRESRDLDFFFHTPLDLEALRQDIGRLGRFAVSRESEDTLAGVFSATKVEIFDASALRLLAKPTVVAGLRIASLQDLMAMKLKVMAERGEMRDYFDVKMIDEAGGVSVEEGVNLNMARYGIGPPSEAIPHLYRAMGDLSDVEVDKSIPISKRSLQKWWSRRQVEVIQNSNRFA